jgi:hypothetical protein
MHGLPPEYVFREARRESRESKTLEKTSRHREQWLSENPVASNASETFAGRKHGPIANRLIPLNPVAYNPQET